MATKEDGNGAIEEVVVTASRLPSITQLELDRILRYLDGTGGGGRPAGGGATSPTTDSQENDPLEEIVVTAERLPNLTEEELRQLEIQARFRELLRTIGDGSPVIDSVPTGTTMEDILDALRRYADWQTQQEILRRIPAGLEFPYPAPQPDVPDIFEDTTVDIPTDLGYEDILNGNIPTIDLPEITIDPTQDTPIEVDEETGDITIGVPTPVEGAGEGDGTGGGSGGGDGQGTGTGEGSDTGDATGGGTVQGGIDESGTEDTGIILTGGTGEGNAGFGNDSDTTNPINVILDSASSDGGGGGDGLLTGSSGFTMPTAQGYMGSISFNPQLLTPYMPRQATDYLAELIARLQR